jgi:hypothetical protein
VRRQRHRDHRDRGANFKPLLLHVLGQLARHPGLGGGEDEVPLARGIGQQAVQDAGIAEHARPVTGDGAAKRLLSLALGVEGFPAHANYLHNRTVVPCGNPPRIDVTGIPFPT